MSCKYCGDTGWVCEEHPKKPWNEGSGHVVQKMSGEYKCEAAGAPCECNKTEPPWHFEPPKDIA